MATKIEAVKLTGDESDLVRAFHVVKNELRSMTRQIGVSTKQTESHFSSMSKNVKRYFGFQALYNGARQATAAFHQLATVASQYHLQVQTAGAVTNSTAQELARMREITMHLGATTKFTATQAAEALKFLGMAGFTASQSIEALPGVLDLAAAGSLDLGRAADITTNVLTGMQIPISELGRVNDVLAKTATSTNTSVEELGVAFSYAGATANQYGLTIEETAAALGLLGNVGMKAERGGTALRGMLIRLGSPTKEASKMLNELGIKAFDASGKFKKFDDVLTELAPHIGNVDLMSTVFAQRSGPAVIALIQQGIDTIKDQITALEDAYGTAETIQDRIMEGLPKATAEFEAAWEALKIHAENWFGASKYYEIATSIVRSTGTTFKQQHEQESRARQGAAIIRHRSYTDPALGFDPGQRDPSRVLLRVNALRRLEEELERLGVTIEKHKDGYQYIDTLTGALLGGTGDRRVGDFFLAPPSPETDDGVTSPASTSTGTGTPGRTWAEIAEEIREKHGVIKGAITKYTLSVADKIAQIINTQALGEEGDWSTQFGVIGGIGRQSLPSRQIDFGLVRPKHYGRTNLQRWGFREGLEEKEDSGVSFKELFTKSFSEDFGKDIRRELKKLEGGFEDLGKALGRLIGEGLAEAVGDGLEGKVGGWITGKADKLGGKMGGLLGMFAGPLGSIVGGLAEWGIGKLMRIGGPSKDELEGREAATGWLEELEKEASSAQRLEALKAGWEDSDLATSWIVMRDEVTSAGGSAEKADYWFRRMQTAIKQGGDAVEIVRAEYDLYIDSLNETSQATADAEARTKKLEEIQRQMLGVPTEEAVENIEDIVEAFALLSPEDQARAMGAFADHLWSARTAGIELGPELERLAWTSTAGLRKMESAAEAFGFSAEKLGMRYHSGRLDERLEDTAANLEALMMSGLSVGQVVSRMSDEAIKGINDQVNAAIRLGTEVPTALRPLITVLAEQGRLTDNNGKLLTDISEIKFADGPTQETKAIIGVAELLAQVFGVDLPKSLQEFEGAAEDAGTDAEAGLNPVTTQAEAIKLSLQQTAAEAKHQFDLIAAHATLKADEMKATFDLFKTNVIASFFDMANNAITEINRILTKIRDIPKRIGIKFAASGNIVDGLRVQVLPMAAGGVGHVSRPTLFYSAGDEDFAFSGEGRRFGAGAGGDIYVHVEAPVLDGVRLAEPLIKRIPLALNRQGFRR